MPFDLKITKLEGSKWERVDNKILATQLLSDQGVERWSIKNRLFILFDHSKFSSVKFLKINELLIKTKIYEMCREPNKFWFYLEDYNTYQCIIWLRKGEYKELGDIHEHNIGPGMREPEKAIYENYLLREVSKYMYNLEVNNNIKQHGIDGWLIWEPMPIPSLVQPIFGGKIQ